MSEATFRHRLNVLDLTVLGVLVIALGAFGAAKAGKTGLARKVKGETTVEIDCFIRGAIAHPERLMKAGDKTFITLRNVPYSSVFISAVQARPKGEAIPSADGKRLVALPDPSEPFGKDLVVTIREKATLTDDGVVFGDSKIKVGTPIEIEGFAYRLRGSIVDVRTFGAAGRP
ncbi:MAG: DUF4330 domain-containing protein [Candidatus Sericytochromatia bacterium]|nr:DUF4330 domain-containing protein [Candidatus Sericytochromatia bacterium]